jgi:hypothetical protein
MAYGIWHVTFFPYTPLGYKYWPRSRIKSVVNTTLPYQHLLLLLLLLLSHKVK